MPQFDMSLDELRAYRSGVSAPADFGDFWASTIAEARTVAMEPVVTAFDAGLSEIDVFDVEFPGFGGHPVKAWLLLPHSRTEPLPTIVEYNGYGGGRGLPHEHLAWAAAGYAHLFMDTRGQGAVWGTGGGTIDPVGSGPATPGFMTRGIRHRDDYYYRRVFTDAVRAIDAVRTMDAVDASRIVVCGGSQGGGITLAVAGLVPEVVAAMPDVPFLCDFPRALCIAPRPPFTEIVQYLSVHRHAVDEVMSTLAYFDGVNFARRASCPALFSVALMDDIVPPSTVFGAYNEYGGETDIEIYPFNGHEAGQGMQWRAQARWISERLA